jgi:hypothetical protein
VGCYVVRGRARAVVVVAGQRRQTAAARAFVDYRVTSPPPPPPPPARGMRVRARVRAPTRPPTMRCGGGATLHRVYAARHGREACCIVRVGGDECDGLNREPSGGSPANIHGWGDGVGLRPAHALCCRS